MFARVCACVRVVVHITFIFVQHPASLSDSLSGPLAGMSYVVTDTGGGGGS